MALSSVQIANLALGKIGADSTIESLTENSAEANIVNLWFEHSREQTLSAFNWQFARKREALATHADDPPGEWAYRYVYPADCLIMRHIQLLVKTDDPIPFDIELSSGTKSILTDLTDAIAIYTIDTTDTFLYTPWFIETFATIIGGHIALSLTGRPEIMVALQTEGRNMLVFANVMDASEKQEDPARDADQIRGRA